LSGDLEALFENVPKSIIMLILEKAHFFKLYIGIIVKNIQQTVLPARAICYDGQEYVQNSGLSVLLQSELEFHPV
jgi:hypothetical protein